MTSDSRNSLRRHDPDQVWTVGAASAPSQPGAPDSREGHPHHNGNYPGSGNVDQPRRRMCHRRNPLRARVEAAPTWHWHCLARPVAGSTTGRARRFSLGPRDRRLKAVMRSLSPPVTPGAPTRPPDWYALCSQRRRSGPSRCRHSLRGRRQPHPRRPRYRPR